MSTTTQETPAVEEKVGIGAYLSLIFAIIFFSGLCASSHWWGCLTSPPSTAASASSFPA